MYNNVMYSQDYMYNNVMYSQNYMYNNVMHIQDNTQLGRVVLKLLFRGIIKLT